ncbi:MAG TPA: CoA transferase [Bacillota bacterium]|nr:CoA transferase [Bacillota bacterium]
MKKWQDVQRVPAPAIIPTFGPLSGMRVLTTGGHLAMPYAASMLAEFGAEVLYIERPGMGDPYRLFSPFLKGENGQQVGASWVQEARNRLSITLETNLNMQEAREVFFALIKNSDIWMENVVWTDKLGIYDEELLEVNPSLVICHVSGYGKAKFGGDPEKCDRGSFDIIGQAASGWLILNGDPDRPPMRGNPGVNDYVSSLYCLFGALAAYVHAQKTGQGQVVDIAQFEAQAKVIADYVVLWANEKIMRERTGNQQFNVQPYNVFMAKDKYVVLGAIGPAVFSRFIKAIGLDPNVYTREAVSSGPEALASPIGREFDRIVKEWISQRTAKEVEDHMAKFKVPCQVVVDADDIINDPHWIDRGDIIEYKDQTTKRKVKAVGVVPKMDKTPGKIWRGAPAMGQDTEAILTRICGYGPEDIAVLREKGVI